MYKEDGDSSQGLTVESVLERIRSFKIEIFQRVRGILGGDKRRNLEFFVVSLFGGELGRSISLGLVCLVFSQGTEWSGVSEVAWTDQGVGGE